MIIVKILFIISLWVSIGVFTHFLMYTRRKITGLDTGGPFKVVSGKYAAFHHREHIEKNDITGFAMLLLGPLGFIVWFFGTFIFLICPLIAYLLATGVNKLFYILFGLKDVELELDNFINIDVPNDDGHY